MDASVAALLGALIGAAAGVVGQILTAAYTDRTERRRLAVESGFREWEQLLQQSLARNQGISMFPPVLFVHFNVELLRLIDSKEGLTAANYQRLARMRDEMRDVIQADSDRRTAEMRERR